MTTKLNHIKSALRESIEIAGKATEGPWRHLFPETSNGFYYINDQNDSQVAVCYDEPTEANAAFVSHARTMTPLACKALLLAIERLELGLKCKEANEGLWAFSFNTLESITSTWPDA